MIWVRDNLIKYLEIHPQYQERIFFCTFIKLAHQAFIQKSKVIINETNRNQWSCNYTFDHNEEN